MTVYIIYASTSGNTEIVCETIANAFRKKGIDVVLSRSEMTDIETIKKNKRFVFGTSTWEHGRLNPFFETLFSQMKDLNFENKQAAFVGLGDRRYEPVLFCEGIKQINRLWIISGGEKVGNPLLIQCEPYELLNTAVSEWAYGIVNAFKNG